MNIIFGKLKNFSFWERLFSWKLIKGLKSKNDSINAEAQVRQISIPESFEDVKNIE